ncbi:MAG: carbohydrate porin [Candidatus Omnitrophica bacterium]|nr:carbohydrate porin [Candidatus Omnitrophota bacterium]
MTRRIAPVFIVLCTVVVAFGAARAYAQEVSNVHLLQEIRQLKQTVAEQAQRIGELEDRMGSKQKPAARAAATAEVPEELSEQIDKHLNARIPAYKAFEGLDFTGWVTTIGQYARNANGADMLSRTEDATDASYTAHIILDKKFGDYGWGLVHFQGGNGVGVTDELQLFSNVNYDATDTDSNASITEAWYEHYFEPWELSLTVGKLDAFSYIDTNEYAYDQALQFLGNMFCNSPVIEFPTDSGEAAVRLAWEPTEKLVIDVLAMDSNADGEDIFDALFLATQLNFKPALFGRSGNYRLIFWQNNAGHTTWMDTTEDKENGLGWGVSFDQEFTDCLGGFFRYGWQDPDVYLNGESVSLYQSYSFGPQIKGALWGRKEDVVGIGFGQAVPSKKYKEANGLIAKTESHLECYYAFKANEHFTISPDLQVIWRPYGKDAANGDGTIVVSGLRGQLDF